MRRSEIPLQSKVLFGAIWFLVFLLGLASYLVSNVIIFYSLEVVNFSFLPAQLIDLQQDTLFAFGANDTGIYIELANHTLSRAPEGLQVRWYQVDVDSNGANTTTELGSVDCSYGVCAAVASDAHLRGQFGVPPYRYITAQIHCTSSCDGLSSLITGGYIHVFSNNIFPNEMGERLWQANYNTRSHVRLRWPSGARRLTAHVGMDALDTHVERLFVDHFYYTVMDSADTFVDYAVRTGSVVVDIIFGLPQTFMKTPMLTFNNLDVIAIVGNYAAGAMFVNFIIYKIHFYQFWKLENRDKPLERDESTTSFLKSCKRQDLAEVEDDLLHSVTCGGLQKYGIQTKHIFQFFTTERTPEMQDLYDAIIDDVNKFAAKRRVAHFMKRQGRAQPAPMPEGKGVLDAKVHPRETRRAQVEGAQVYTALALYELYGELAKLRSVIEIKLSEQAEKYRLAEALRLGSRR